LRISDRSYKDGTEKKGNGMQNTIVLILIETQRQLPCG